MLGKKLGIDLGTSTVRVVTRGEAEVFSEPSVIARRRDGRLLMGSAVDAAGEVELLHPLHRGAIGDRRALTLLLTQIVHRTAGRQRIFRPDLVMAIPPSLGDPDRRHLLDVLARLGVRTAYLIDSPIAAALGAGCTLTTGQGHLIVDAGAGTVDVASIAFEGGIAKRTDPGAGEALAGAIAARVQALHGVVLDRGEAERIAGELACVGTHEERRLAVAGTRDGEAVTVSVASTEIGDLVDDLARRVTQLVVEVLDETPAALRHDIHVEGAVLCGGLALLEGLDRHLAATAGVGVRVATDPRSCVIRGTGTAIESLDVLRRSFMYIR